eukprot:scaffold693_cov399-Prasinococcus_capsulatus_cf.AAC.33
MEEGGQRRQEPGTEPSTVLHARNGAVRGSAKEHYSQGGDVRHCQCLRRQTWSTISDRQLKLRIARFTSSESSGPRQIIVTCLQQNLTQVPSGTLVLGYEWCPKARH